MLNLNLPIKCNKKLPLPNMFTFLSKLVISLIGIFLLIQPTAHAVVVFSDGQPSTYTDVNQQDTFVGGFNMNNPASPLISGPTSMTFTTQNLARNDINSIFGGNYYIGIGVPSPDAIIQGNTNIIMYNTDALAVYGGGYVENGNSIVTGIANISLYNSTVFSVYGGGGATYVPAQHDFLGHVSVGGVNILIDHSNVTELSGSSATVGIQSEGRYSVFGDININVLNGSHIDTLFGTSESSAHIKGNLSINIENSEVDNLYCISHAYLDKDLTLTLGQGAVVHNLLLSSESGLGGSAKFFINGATVDYLRFGLIAGALKPSTITMREGLVTTLDLSPATAAGISEGVDLSMEGGTITTLNLCPSQGASYWVRLNMQGGEINTLDLGTNSGLGGTLNAAIIEMANGKIGTFRRLPGVQNASLIFTPGSGSNIFEMLPGASFDNITLQPGSRTTWGREGNVFSIEGKYVTLAGTLVTPPSSTVNLTVENQLTLDGGSIELEKIDTSKTTPFLILNGAPACTLDVQQPLNVILSLEPSYVGSSGVSLATATGSFLSHSNMFVPNVTKGLMWGDIAFDNNTNTWYINNIRESKDYYAYSSVRGASSWLRQQHIIMAQRRSAQALLDKHDGLWVDVQGGYEKLEIKEGKSKMPWVMASAGYDFRHQPIENFALLYGFSCGFGDGHQHWKSANKMKNKILIGLLDAYVGIQHDSGVYGVAVLQGSVNKTKTNNTGFVTKNTWTDIVPTESLELGWRYIFNEDFSVTPRAQVIFEQLPSHQVSFNYGALHEDIKLKRTATITTVAGLAIDYTLYSFDFRGSVDWIKGCTGEYGAHSKYFNKTFKDKNNTDVIRVSLGCELPIIEHMNIGVNIFGDMVDDKGLGGQATLSYKF